MTAFDVGIASLIALYIGAVFLEWTRDSRSDHEDL